jgi:hypothetical protein
MPEIIVKQDKNNPSCIHVGKASSLSGTGGEKPSSYPRDCSGIRNFNIRSLEERSILAF